MKLGERDRSFSTGPVHEDICIQGGKCHRNIGGMGSYAFIGPSEDGVIAIEAVEASVRNTLQSKR